MSRITICDVCREQDGLTQRLKVAGPIYPHKGEMISEMEWIDICTHCLRRVRDLSTAQSLDELQRIFRSRMEDEGGAA
jgi:hypothetical protein